MKKAFSGVMLLLVMNAFAIANSVQPRIARTIAVPDDYLTIREALSAASEGDTVFVRSGRYNETVTVDKALSLIGEHKETTFICGDHKRTVVQVNADNVTISGFSIESTREMGSGGVGLNLRADCSIVGNILSNNWYGIGVFGCHNVRVVDNIMTNDQYGFAGDSCSNCHITGNTASDCYGGIGIDDSSNIEIAGNNISNCESFGIASDYPMDNNYLGGNRIADCFCGICLNFLALDYNETGNIIAGNEISNSQQGGIELYHSSNTVVTANDVVGNLIGISLDTTSLNNTVYHNNLIDNAVHAHSYLPNVWDDGYPSGGNYWSSHLGVDLYMGALQDVPGSDGKTDTPYEMNSNDMDHYPLVYAYGSPAPPTYTLSVSATVGGTTSPASGSYIYAQAQDVPVEAIPSSGYSLHHWELDGINVGAQTFVNVLMNSNHNLNAVFSSLTYSVSVEAFCVSENASIGETIMMDGLPTGYETPHVFTGLMGVHNFTVLLSDANGHLFKQWSTGQASTTLIVSSGGEYVAFYDARYSLEITSSTGGTTSPTPGMHDYWSETQTSVTALTYAGHYLDYWQLDGTEVGAPNPIDITMDSNHTLYASFKQLSLGHDVAAKWMSSKAVVGTGYNLTINVTVLNVGSYAEALSVFVCANATPISLQGLTLESGASAIITFKWNTTGWAKGRYNMSSHVSSVPFETETEDNNFTDGIVLITFVGDVNGDGKVRVDDVYAVASRFGTNSGGPPNSRGFYYDANCDVNDDLKIRVDDVYAAAQHYGQGP